MIWICRKKQHKLDKTLSVRLKWVATQSFVGAASDDTQEITVTLRVPVERESTRGGIATLVRGFGRISPEKIVDIWLPLNAFWARISAFLG